MIIGQIRLKCSLFDLYTGVAAAVLYRKQYMQKRQGERFSNFDSSSFADSDTFNTISYADCAGIEVNKVSSPEAKTPNISVRLDFHKCCQIFIFFKTEICT